MRLPAQPLVMASSLIPNREMAFAPPRRGEIVRQLGPEDDDRPDPERSHNIPIVAGDEKSDLKPAEASMPRGQYDRSKSKPRRAKALREAAAAASPPKPAPAAAAAKAIAKLRKKPAAAKRAKKREPEPRPQRARPHSEARFAVFNDGAVLIEAEGCKGKLSAEEARDLVAFIDRLSRA